jgi:hypothetical protein
MSHDLARCVDAPQYLRQPERCRRICLWPCIQPRTRACVSALDRIISQIIFCSL